MPNDCRNCRYFSFDMDMDAFCVHPNANAVGTNLNAMRGSTKTPNMRGEPCGPHALFFQPDNRSAA